MVEHLKKLLTDQIALMRAAVQVLDESRIRVSAFADRLDNELTISERESCAASQFLIAGFACIVLVNGPRIKRSGPKPSPRLTRS